ncbi:hypothetical protein [Sorangium sp. So ce854]
MPRTIQTAGIISTMTSAYRSSATTPVRAASTASGCPPPDPANPR